MRSNSMGFLQKRKRAKPPRGRALLALRAGVPPPVDPVAEFRPARPRPRGRQPQLLRRPSLTLALLALLALLTLLTLLTLILCRTRSGIRRCRLQRDDRRGNVRRLLDELPTGCP